MKDEYALVGGGSIYLLGTRNYVKSYFLAIEQYVLKSKYYSRLDWSLITDRLYKRTIADDMMDIALGTMLRLNHLLAETLICDVQWSKIGLFAPYDGRAIDPKGTLRDLYLPFERGLESCASGVKFGAIDSTIYPQLRISRTETSVWMYEERRPSKDYEALGPNDLPFWLRDDIDYPEIPVIVMDGNNPA